MGQRLPPLPMDFPPGFVLGDAPLASAGRFTGGHGIRFVRGRAEKRGGYSSLLTSPLIGIPRGCATWNDLTARQVIGVGTASKLYGIGNNDFLPADITPLISTQSVTNPFTTTSGSTSVKVNVPAHGASVGQYINTSGSSAVGGLTLNGSYPIATVIDANNVTIIAPAAANASATGGGATTISVELEPGTVNIQAQFGWGAGPWGAGTWGTPRQTSTLLFYPRIWSVDNFGKIGIFCPSLGGIYSWDPTAPLGTRATRVVGSSGGVNPPSVCQGIVCTSDDIVIAYGVNYSGTQDPLSWWCSAQGDFTNWDVAAVAGPQGAPSAQARVNSGTMFLAGADLGIHVALLWTDESAYAFQYVGNQFVFDVQRLGARCGIAGPLAYVVVDTKAYWVGESGFWQYEGGIARMPNQSDILETFLAEARPFYNYQIIAWYDEQYDEVCFGYCSGISNENNKCVVYNRAGQFWYTDTFIAKRTCTTKFTGQLTDPLFFSDDGILYQDDQGLDANGTAKDWSLSYAAVEIASGQASVKVDGLVADMERQVGTVTADLTATDRTPAQGTIIDQQSNTGAPSDGVIDFRVSGRQVQMTLSGDGVGCDFRMGIPKLLRRAGGDRR